MLRIPVWLLLIAVAQAATPVFKTSFDNAENWAAVRGSARLDSTVLREGHKSLRLERDNTSQDACVRLAAVTLAIGKRYELQHSFLNGCESEVPIYKDFAVSDELLRHRDVVFVGRPEANSALALWAARLGLDYQGASFTINGEVHASEREALLLAADNPLDATHMLVVVAGKRRSQHGEGPRDGTDNERVHHLQRRR